MNLKFKTIVKIFRKIMQLNAVNILKSLNEYYRKIIQKSGRKMALYPLCYEELRQLTVSKRDSNCLFAFH